MRGGRLDETCELMNKNLIEGRRTRTSWHNTAKSNSSGVEVNGAVAQGSNAFLPGEALVVKSRQGVSRGHSSEWRAGGWKRPVETTKPEDSKP